MKHYYSGLIYWGLFSSLLIIALFSACTKYDAKDMFVKQSVEIRRIIEESIIKGSSINSVIIKQGRLLFSLSSSDEFLIPEKYISLIQIRSDGYWYLNGLRSEWKWEEIDGMELIEVEASEQDINPIIPPSIIGIIESYRDWTFVFSDKVSLTLVKTSHSYDYDTLLLGINHRGYNRIAPENTLPAFRLSRLEGFTYVETDIHFTADGVPVCIHDSSVDRTSNGSGNVKELMLSQLKELDFGSWKGAEYCGTNIPTLGEFLELCKSIGLSPCIELKEGTSEQVAEVVRLVSKYELRCRTSFVSFFDTLLEYVLKSDPYAQVGLLVNSINSETVRRVANLRHYATEPSQVYISSSSYDIYEVDLCKTNAIPLLVWTLDSIERILSLPSYISGVTSNYLHAGRVMKENSR